MQVCGTYSTCLDSIPKLLLVTDSIVFPVQQNLEGQTRDYVPNNNGESCSKYQALYTPILGRYINELPPGEVHWVHKSAKQNIIANRRLRNTKLCSQYYIVSIFGQLPANNFEKRQKNVGYQSPIVQAVQLKGGLIFQ